MTEFVDKAEVLAVISQHYTNDREVNDLLDKLHEAVMEIRGIDHISVVFTR